MYNQTLNDITNLERWLGIVPTFRPGPCDKTLEDYEGRPFPDERKYNFEEDNDSIPFSIIEIDKDGKINIISQDEIIAKIHSDEIGPLEIENGFNSRIYYF